MSDRRSIDVGEEVQVEMPADAVASLAAIKRDRHPNAYAWPEWKDEVIRKYWWNTTQYTHEELSFNVLKVSPNTARKRARELGMYDE